MKRENERRYYGEKTFDDGVYEGDLWDPRNPGDGVRDGTGEFNWTTIGRHGTEKYGDSYRGEWKDNKMHGEGTYWDNICRYRYEGRFKEGKRHGYGKLFTNIFDGQEPFAIYEGMWKNGMKHGKGKESDSRLTGRLPHYGSIYEGDFKEGKKHGYGNLYPGNEPDSKWRYEGEWKDDKFHGKGKLTTSYRKKHEQGEDGMIHVVAVYWDTFDGTWKNGRITYGKWGTTEENNVIMGNGYEGEFGFDERGSIEREGKGKCYYQNGDRYEGEWNQDNRKGNGKYYFANGDRYEGEWDSCSHVVDNDGGWIFWGKKHGKGKYFFANGDRYDGEWKDGLKHGIGVLMESGVRYMCKYHEGEQISKENIGDSTRKQTYGMINPSLVNDWSNTQIGEGGFAVIFSAKYVGAPVAIKVIKSLRTVKKNQIAEVLTMMKLRHPFTLTCHGYFLTNKKKTLNIVMDLMDMNVVEYCEMVSLKKKLVVMKKMAHALQFLHTKTESKPLIIHNDVKPSNFLVSKDGLHVKISDFGLSKVKRNSNTFSKNSSRSGTFVYFSPEYALEGNYSVYSDIYALGISFYELLFNNEPFFELDCLNNIMFMKKLQSGDYYPKYFKEDEDEGIARVPKDIYDELLMKMWNKSPKIRISLKKVTEYLQKRAEKC